MTSFYLLFGLAVFAAGAAMYVAHASRHEPRWVAASFFFPFVVPLYYRRHWDDLRIAALLQAGGLAMIVAGGLMVAVQLSSAPSTLDGGGFPADGGAMRSGFVDSEEALQLLVRQERERVLGGRVASGSFRLTRAELLNGVLRFIEGDGTYPDREVAVFLGDRVRNLGERWSLNVAPGDTDAPMILVSRRGEDGMPVSEQISSGYRLELQLFPGKRDKLSGLVRMMLPDVDRSYLQGEFVAITSHLRYVGEEVDRDFDHEDTLFFVAEEFLGTQYAEGDVERVSFSQTRMQVLDHLAETIATVGLRDGREARHVIKFARAEFGWTVQVPESMAATEAAGFHPVYRVVPEAVATRTERPRTAPAARPVPAREVVVSFAQLADYAGRAATVEYVGGRREDGVLRGLRRNRLVLEAIMAGGKVEYLVAPEELAAVRLAGAEVLRLQAAATPVTAAAVEPPASVVTAPVSEGPATTAGGRDFAEYLNRSVTVVTVDGKTITGVFRGTSRDRLMIESIVGTGTVNQPVAVEQLASIGFAAAP
jgi:hypothetical protein